MTFYPLPSPSTNLHRPSYPRWILAELWLDSGPVRILRGGRTCFGSGGGDLSLVACPTPRYPPVLLYHAAKKTGETGKQWWRLCYIRSQPHDLSSGVAGLFVFSIILYKLILSPLSCLLLPLFLSHPPFSSTLGDGKNGKGR